MSTPEELLDAVKLLWSKGMAPATSGNFSIRDDDHLWMTASGRDKGTLVPDDVLKIKLESGKVVNTFGKKRSGKRSAEFELHQTIYDVRPELGAVLHVHSRAATVLSRVCKQPTVILRDYELLKAMDGVTSHAQRLGLPIFENTQDITELAQATRPLLEDKLLLHGYLVAGHGLYTWGKTLGDAMRHVEALDFLLQCELDQLMMTGSRS